MNPEFVPARTEHQSPIALQQEIALLAKGCIGYNLPGKLIDQVVDSSVVAIDQIKDRLGKFLLEKNGEDVSNDPRFGTASKNIHALLALVRATVAQAAAINTPDPSLVSLSPNNEPYNYFREFLESFSFTRKLGFSVDSPQLTDNRYLTGDAANNLLNLTFQRYPELHGAGYVGSCLVLHSVLTSIAKEYFECGAHLTIGYITTDKKELFYAFPRMYAEQALGGARALDPNDLKLHAWVTLDSGEILDYTIAPSLVFAGYRDKRYGDLILKGNPNLLASPDTGSSDELSGGIMYRPTVIGIEYLSRIGVPSVIL